MYAIPSKRAFLVAASLFTLAAAPAWAAWPASPTVNVPVCTETEDDEATGAVSDGAGGVIVAWYGFRTDHFVVFVQRVGADGTPLWTTDGVAIAPLSTDETTPSLTTDGAGGAIVVWLDRRNPSIDLYAQRVNSAGVPQWTAGGVAICTAAQGQNAVRMIPDGAGGAIIAWQDFRSGVVTDLYAQRVNHSGVTQWTANGVVVNNLNETKSGLALVSDDAGGAIAEWTDSRNADPDIYAQRISSTGSQMWAAAGVPVTTATGSQGGPLLTTDGSSGAIAVWMDYRNGGWPDLYAQRIDASGAAVWTANGVPVSVETEGQQMPSITTDGAGGAIMAWEDERFITPFHIFAQRIDASGAPVWTVNGNEMCGGASGHAIVTTDGSGGAIVTWNDYRNSAYTYLYAQRVTGAGTVLWTTDGVPIANSPAVVSNQILVPGATGGLIAAWVDDRNQTSYITNNDVFVQNLNGDGTLGTPTTAVPHAGVTAGFSLGAIEPNPCRGEMRVQFTLADAVPASLELFDLAGRRVASREWSSPGAGVRVASFAAGGLRPGVYAVRLTQGARAAWGKAVVVR